MSLEKLITIMKTGAITLQNQTSKMSMNIYIALVDKLKTQHLYIRNSKFSARIYYIKQLLDEVEHDIMNYQNRGLCYASADNTDTRF